MPQLGRERALTLASRLENLGTETAFAVSLAAAEWGAKGNRIYPFHLGDIDLATPSNIIAASQKAIADGYTGYCPGAGIAPLREALAENIGGDRGLDIHPDQVVVQPGGKPVITKFIQAVMNEGDEVLYPNPGYPIYESQIEYFGGTALPYGYIPTETGFRIDLEKIESQITPKTKAIIYNDLQNPIAAESSDEERQAVADLAIKHNLFVLSDEAYFEMRYAGESKSIASLPGMADRTVILYTFSKKFAMTGWRLGAAVAPLSMAPTIAKLNTNNESCTTHFVQHAGIEAVRGDQTEAKGLLKTLQDRRDAACTALNAVDGIDMPVPNATFYLFPEVTAIMDRKGIADVGDFATQALHATGVSFCTRNHFGRPVPGETRKFVRFAYSGLPTSDIEEGLAKLKDWMEA